MADRRPLARSVRKHDTLDHLAEVLWDAYHLEIAGEHPWPPNDPTRYRAWRRAAARALDLGARS